MRVWEHQRLEPPLHEVTNRAFCLQGCSKLFLPGVFDGGRPGRGGMAPGWEMQSGKMGVAARMLEQLRSTTNDRIVIVSNYTQVC